MANSPWKKPRTKEARRRVLARLRNLFLSEFLFKLDRRYPYTFSFDGKEPDRAVQLFWDLAVDESVTWSDQYGCLGKIITVFENGYPLAMAQAGGVVVPREVLEEIPSDMVAFQTHIASNGSRDQVVLVALTIDYFLSSEAIQSYGRGSPEEPQLIYKDTVKDNKLSWHSVHVKAWKAVISRMAKKNMPNEAKLQALRKEFPCPED